MSALSGPNPFPPAEERSWRTVSCHLANPEVHPQSEEYWGHVNPIGPRACYDEGKRVAETMCYAYMKQEGVEVRVARIFNTFGPRMHMNDGRVVSNFILQALQGEPLTFVGCSLVHVAQASGARHVLQVTFAEHVAGER
ncbi:hypothetical protein GH733_009411 [Mirounga leonina]|nr:hypothetical protein GH733_009411 [Mirounga leonina]